MGVMSSAAELMTAFVGLEMSSISTYILAGYRRDALRSNESAMKYFLLGSFATAFFLYGIALVYGATGTTQLTHMSLDCAARGRRLAEGRTGADFRGLGIQGRGGSFSAVDSRRVRRRAHARDRADVRRAQGSGIRVAAAHPGKCACRGIILVLGAVDFGRADDVRGKSGGASRKPT